MSRGSSRFKQDREFSGLSQRNRLLPPMGRRTPAGDRRGGRGAPGRDRVREPVLWPQGGRGVASRARAAGNAGTTSPHARRIQFCRPVPAGADATGRRHGQGGVVQELRGKRASRQIRPGRAELGHRQQGLRAQRFQRVHQLGDQGQEPLSAARNGSAHGISRIEARGMRAMRRL